MKTCLVLSQWTSLGRESGIFTISHAILFGDWALPVLVNVVTQKLTVNVAICDCYLTTICYPGPDYGFAGP